MRRPYLTVTMNVWWIGAGSLFLLGLLTMTGQLEMRWNVPLLFWTSYGGLLLAATALAISLPEERRVFWQALVASLITIWILTRHSQSGLVSLLQLPFDRSRDEDLLWVLVQRDRWSYHVALTLLITLLAFVNAGLAHVAQPWLVRERSDGFRFTLLQLLVACALVALACVSLRSSTTLVSRLTQASLEVALLLAIVFATASHGRHIFANAFLAGALAWWTLVDFDELLFEWESWLPIATSDYYAQTADRWGTTRRGQLLRNVERLLPLVAGTLTGIAATIIHRRQRNPPAAQQKAEP